MPGRITVLHVDDDPETLALSERYLGGSVDGGPQIEMVTATSAAEGLSELESRRVDCVVSDSMTFDDGEPFVVAVGRHDPEIPIILYSAMDLGALANEIDAGDASAYLRKADGDDFAALRSQVRSLAGARRNRRGSASSPTDSTAEGDGTSHPSLSGDWTVVGRHDWTGPRELDTTILEALAAYCGEDPTEFDCLYHSVDADALADLLAPTPSGRTRQGTQVRFPYLEYDLAVTADGSVAVRSRGQRSA